MLTLFADLKLPCDPFCSARKLVNTSNLAGDIWLCDPPQGPPTAGTVPAFPKGTPIVTPSSTLDSGLTSQSTVSHPHNSHRFRGALEAPIRAHGAPSGGLVGQVTGNWSLSSWTLFWRAGHVLLAPVCHHGAPEISQSREQMQEKQREPSNGIVSAPGSSCA